MPMNLGSVTCPACGGLARVVATGAHIEGDDPAKRQLVVTLDVDCACPHPDAADVEVPLVTHTPRKRPARRAAAKKAPAKRAAKKAPAKATKTTAAKKAPTKKASKR